MASASISAFPHGWWTSSLLDRDLPVPTMAINRSEKLRVPSAVIQAGQRERVLDCEGIQLTVVNAKAHRAIFLWH